jgi:hypothetical protein
MRTFNDETRMMRNASGALHAAPSYSLSAGAVLSGRVLLAWRALLVAALLSLALGAAL